jgi:hypothetical protein
LPAASRAVAALGDVGSTPAPAVAGGEARNSARDAALVTRESTPLDGTLHDPLEEKPWRRSLPTRWS